MSRVEQSHRPHELDDPIRASRQAVAGRATSRSQRRADVRARLQRAKEHLQSNALFALTADQIDQISLQQAQWEATAYAAAAEILSRAQAATAIPATDTVPTATPTPAPSYHGRHHEGRPYYHAEHIRTRSGDHLPALDEMRPQLWPIVTALIEHSHGNDDLEEYYGRLHLTFTWVEQNSEHMPHAGPEIERWLREHCHVLRENAGR